MKFTHKLEILAYTVLTISTGSLAVLFFYLALTA